jgi:calcium-dependent protein kinase
MGGLSGDYLLQEVIGQGGFAIVHKCLHLPTNQTRAVKIIHKAGLTLEQIDLRHRLNEIKVLKSLDHPNILRCFELFEDSSRFYIVTEYCGGGELFSKLGAQKKISEAPASKVMMQILSSLAYCHSKRIVHRDLKPENILLEDDDFNLKVGDFGSSAFLDVYNKTSGGFGSAYYMAPEVLSGQFTESCDIWSAGIILFIMLTGRPPYPGKTEQEIIHNIKKVPFEIKRKSLKGLSSGAVDLLTQLLRPDPTERIEAALAVRHPWVQSWRSNSGEALANDVLLNLRGFNASYKLKDAVHTYLAANVISMSEMHMLRDAFQRIDIDCDGKISKDELMMQFRQYTSEEQATEEVECILQEVDSSRSGMIDYSEFLRVCMDKDKALDKANLELAFRFFDKHGTGTIAAQEVQDVLGVGETVSEGVWGAVISEVDRRGEGLLDFEEFLRLMLE